jgi:hypothetical protein
VDKWGTQLLAGPAITWNERLAVFFGRRERNRSQTGNAAEDLAELRNVLDRISIEYQCLVCAIVYQGIAFAMIPTKLLNLRTYSHWQQIRA